jgi:spermidine/putrescine transport system permease protein
VLLFLYLPVGLVVVYSFNDSAANVLWKGFTVRWYARVWSQRPLMASLWNSLMIAAVVTAISTVLGTLAAWLLYRYRFPGGRAVRGLIFFPMVVPEIIMGVSLLLLFARLGVERGFLTVIIAHVTFCFPFVMIAVQARLRGLDPSLEEAALDLGASPAAAFLRVIVPFLLPAIIAGALMAFTLSLDEFVVTYFTCDAASTTLPVRLYGMVKVGIDPSINALSTVLVLATLVLIVAAHFVRRLSR